MVHPLKSTLSIRGRSGSTLSRGQRLSIPRKPRSAPMSNSEIVVQYASTTASTCRCACGHDVYPDSIWNPIVKVTVNKRTQGAQTWEYHLTCIQEFLKKGKLDSQPGTPHIYYEKLKNTRHCILTKDKLAADSRVITLRGLQSRSVSVKIEAFKVAVSQEPLPLQCAAQNVIIDWLVRRQDLPREAVEEKYYTKATKEDFDKASLKIAMFFDRLQPVAEEYSECIKTKPFEMAELFLQQDRYINWTYPLGDKEGRFKIKQFVERFFVYACSLADQIAGTLADGKKNKAKTYSKIISTAALHGYDIAQLEQSPAGSPLVELGEVELQEDRMTSRYTQWRADLMDFLIDYDKKRVLLQDTLVEHLVGDNPLLRQLCKVLQEKSSE